MMKIELRTPLFEQDEYADSANWIEVLKKTKFELKVTAVDQSRYQNQDFMKLMMTKYSRYLHKNFIPDVVLHNVYPHFVIPASNAKNIGIFNFHSSGLEYTVYPKIIKKLDQVLVSTCKEYEECHRLELDNVKQFNPPIDFQRIDKLGKNYNKPECFLGLDNFFKFLYLGELSERKNIRALIYAFTREFHPTERVVLIIATVAESEDQAMQWITKYSQGLITKILIERKPNIMINWRTLSEQEENDLYLSSDAFVMPSYGETTNRPVIKNLFQGIPCLVTANTGMDDLCKYDGCISVASRTEPCDIVQKPFGFMYSGFELFESIDILDLQKKMREIYNSPPIFDCKKQIIENYCMDKISNDLSQIILDTQKNL